MSREEQLELVATFLTGYAKRLMEGAYDRLLVGSVGEHISRLEPGVMYGMEAALYALMAGMGKWMPEAGPLQRAIKSVAMDAPPEVAKRLINGIAPATPRVCGGESGHGKNELLDMPAEEVTDFLAWYAGLAEASQNLLLKVMDGFQPGELAAFVRLPAGARESFLALLVRKRGSSKGASDSPSMLHGLRTALEGFGQSTAEPA